MNIKADLYKEMKSRYSFMYNEDIIVKNNEEDFVKMITNIVAGGVVSIQSEIVKRCDYLYHTLRPATAAELSSDIMREYEYKQKNNNKEKKQILPTYVDINEDKVYILELVCVYNPLLLKQVYIPAVTANTKVALMGLQNQGLAMQGPVIDGILNSEFNTIYDNKDEEYSQDLIQTFRFYVPRNKNGYYRLSGNRYFSCYFKHDAYRFTRDGKMKVPIRDTTLSYFYEQDGVLVHEVTGKKYNPFIYQSNGFEIDMELFEDIISKPDMDVLKRTQQHYKQMINSGEEISKPWDNILVEITDDLIEDTIIDYFTTRGDKKQDDESKFSRYESLLNGGSRNLAIELRRRLVTPNKKGGHAPTELLKKIPHPMSLVTQLKSNKQFPLFNKTNEHDGFFPFTYITKTNEMMITEAQREFKYEDMYIVDPISTSGTKNVGVSGEMCCSISSDLISD